MTHWVIQNNIFAEEGFESLMTVLNRFHLPYTLVKVIPFVGELEAVEGELPPDGADAVVMGSYTLSRVAKQRNWKPGAWLDNLDFEIQRNHWGDRMLNYDAVITTFDGVPFQPEPFFLRPVHDTKAFTGMMVDWGYYESWRDSLRRLPETADPVNDPLGVNLLTKDTPVMVCSKKEIYSETRFWVVDSIPVTWSGYKTGTLKRYLSPDDVDTFLRGYAVGVSSVWSPNRAYVLDVANTSEGPKIVEVNNLNSAGWYKADLYRLVEAIETMDSPRLDSPFSIL
jgi:hypothetical protein